MSRAPSATPIGTSPPTGLTDLTVAEARRRLDAGELSAADLTDAHLARIAALDGDLHSFITVTDEIARVQARDADARIARGEAGALTGIPIALKDNLCTTDAPTTAASRILGGYRSPYDATVVTRLRAQGAVFVGKANTDEFAMGSSTENSAFGTTRNPWARDRVPGGSSGGPAAAVCGWRSDARARLRHRRLDPATGGVLRRRRAEADLRTRLALRTDRFRQQSRPNRTVRARSRTRRCCWRNRWPRPV
jgi:hypothetical protein